MSSPTRPIGRAALLAATLLIPATPLLAQGGDPSRLYGRVTTTAGTVHEGFIRWAGNEAGIYDILSASKPIPERNRRDAERLGWEPEESRNRFEIFGIGFTLPGGRSEIGSSAQSGIRFGHVSSLEVRGRNSARLLLKSGEEVELDGGGDLGSSVSSILVEDRRSGQVELDWRDVEVIDFLSPPAVASRWGSRLYGTVRTRGGERFTGYVAWDMDELFTTDVLDGDDRSGDREIPFSLIRAIERESSSGSRVYLTDGSEVVLRGSNDVNSSNRDIMIADPSLGEVRVDWDSFDRVDLAPVPGKVEPSLLQRSGRLYGTVRARGGETQTGWIRWDNDEEYGWEVLDGELDDGVAVDIELGLVQSIERVGYERSRVTLLDGRSLVLGGSNDVDEGNRGVYVDRADGTLVLVPWDRFESVRFHDRR